MSADVKVINAPERIYLQIGDDFLPGEVDFGDLQEMTWCADNIHGTDITYVRADALETANARIAVLETQITSLKSDASIEAALEAWFDFEHPDQHNFAGRMHKAMDAALAQKKEG
jgi:hypothetical protein